MRQIGCLMTMAAALVVMSCATKKPAEPVPAEPLVEKPAEPVDTTSDVAEEWTCEETHAAWPTFQRTGDRHGAIDAPAIEKPTLRWSAQIGIAGWLNNPIIAGDVVYAPSSGQVWNKPDGSDGVHAFDVKSGESLWFTRFEGDVNAVTYSGCRIFATGDQSGVTALDARTGEVLWNQPSETKVYVNPLITPDAVVVASPGFGIAALSVEDGTEIWSTRVTDVVRGGASTDGVRVYVPTQAKRVIALDVHTGKSIWVAEIEDGAAVEIYAAPTVDGRRLYVSYVRDTVYRVPAIVAYDTSSGEKLWTARNSAQLTGGWGNIRSSPALYDGKLYWGEPYSNRVIALEVDGGEVTASVPAGSCMFPHWPSPAVAGGLLYVPRHDGGLYAIDVATGAVRWSYYLGDARAANDVFPPELDEASSDRCSWDPPFGKAIYASPAVATDGTVFVATGDGWLHAVGNDAVADATEASATGE